MHHHIECTTLLSTYENGRNGLWRYLLNEKCCHFKNICIAKSPWSGAIKTQNGYEHSHHDKLIRRIARMIRILQNKPRNQKINKMTLTKKKPTRVALAAEAATEALKWQVIKSSWSLRSTREKNVFDRCVQASLEWKMANQQQQVSSSRYVIIVHGFITIKWH